jgi:hypothetical protein
METTPQRRHSLGGLANGLIALLWPQAEASGQPAPNGPGITATRASGDVGSGHYDLPTYRRRGIRIPELEGER